MTEKKLNIGLFGFGCVGYGLYEVLEKTSTLKANIKSICVKNKNKQRQIAEHHFTYDKNEILNDKEINVIVELIDDADAAFEIVSTALRKGKAVVSANKKMIAEHFNELLDLQKQYNVPFLYEAACCASIPIIRNLEEYYDNDLLESVEGIVNGSTNYILTKTFAENISYDDALHQAQQNGYAESTPTLDTGGFDAKYKLLILLAHAFGVVVQPNDIFNLGIDNIGSIELNYAKEKNLKIKLVAQAYKTADEKVAAYVLPKFVDNNNKLFTVDDVFNGVITKTCFADQQFFVGKGAGAYPTASAVLSDISALRYNYKYEYKKQNDSLILQSSENIFLKIFLRHEIDHSENIAKHFGEVHESYTNHNAAYTVGIISLQQLQIVSKWENTSAILIESINQYDARNELIDSAGEYELESF